GIVQGGRAGGDERARALPAPHQVLVGEFVQGTSNRRQGQSAGRGEVLLGGQFGPRFPFPISDAAPQALGQYLELQARRRLLARVSICTSHGSPHVRMPAVNGGL